MKDVNHLHCMAALCLALAIIGCGSDAPETSTTSNGSDTSEASTSSSGSDTSETDSSDLDESDPCTQKNLFASEVVSFEAGAEAGYGSDNFPDVVLGPPSGKGNNAGSLDVLSLGIGGTITLGFNGTKIVDEPGADFIVFENPFWVNNSPTNIWFDLAEVSVSDDGETWHVFPCEPVNPDEGNYGQCAGWRTVQEFEVDDDFVLTAEAAGGDAYDIADIGLEQISFIRIRDLAETGAAPSAGFDLDAVGAVHFKCLSQLEE